MTGGCTYGSGAVVSPEDAPAEGDCAKCSTHVTRGSFCCGCGAFVCWTHGEPAAPPGKFTKVPHAVTDHVHAHERTRAA